MFDEISTDIREGEVQSLYKRSAAFDCQGEAKMRKASFRKSCFFRVTLKDRNTSNVQQGARDWYRKLPRKRGSGELGNFVVSEFDKSVEMPTLTQPFECT